MGYWHGGVIIDSYKMYYNTCPCKLDYFTNPGFQEAILNEASTVPLSALSSMMFTEWDYYHTTYNICGVAFTIVSDPSGALSISGTTLTILTYDSTKVGTHTVSLKATTIDGSNYSITQSFDVEIKGCVASVI